ncbi:MAG: preprotein translocase subunit SecY [Candidatus Pacebacteria bacterium]|nr:preprotein translocase subunit SecY [Candidatus Paceibacterota bacterium]
MQAFLQKLNTLFADKQLRKRILFVLGALVVTRLLAAIPIPSINVAALAQFFGDNQFFGLLNIFSGGGLSGLSIVMLGVGPYITASIIVQLLTILSPKLKAMYSEEGEAGRQKISQYSRLLMVPLAALQAFAFITLFQKNGIIPDLTSMQLITSIVVITGGSVLLTWIGEMINEFGIGNGVSIIIFAGIVAGIPGAIEQLSLTFTPDQLPMYIGFGLLSLLVVTGVVVITEAERPIPITYARQIRGNKVYGGVSTYLPLRLNQAGVMPIIFALSILLFPQMIGNFLAASTNPFALKVSSFLLTIFANNTIYTIIYFVLVFLFTYFYTAVTFDPDAISKNLQRSGAFIPGVRPGQSTSEHIGNILTRLTMFGALFLGIIAILPLIMQSVTGITALAIGGTGLLIVISVIVDLLKKIDAQLSLREY